MSVLQTTLTSIFFPMASLLSARLVEVVRRRGVRADPLREDHVVGPRRLNEVRVEVVRAPRDGVLATEGCLRGVERVLRDRPLVELSAVVRVVAGELVGSVRDLGD